jgi:sRNA-binding carbon storage regulator CsrA
MYEVPKSTASSRKEILKSIKKPEKQTIKFEKNKKLLKYSFIIFQLEKRGINRC